jgi:hypothetical protein
MSSIIVFPSFSGAVLRKVAAFENRDENQNVRRRVP